MEVSLELILTCAISSAAFAALITSIKELIIWFLNRRAKLSDEESESKEEKLEKRLKEQQDCLNALKSSIELLEKRFKIYLDDYKLILKDKIRYLVFKYIDIGEITFEEKQAIQHMWNTYHYDLEGNGDLDDVMELLEEVTLIKRR